MSILQELAGLLKGMGVAVETGVFSDVAPDEYTVITPLADTFELYGDNQPGFETQEAQVSIFSKGNYLELKDRIVRALLDGEFTITDRRYLGHEDDSGFHHYAVDTAKLYPN